MKLKKETLQEMERLLFKGLDFLKTRHFKQYGTPLNYGLQDCNLDEMRLLWNRVVMSITLDESNPNCWKDENGKRAFKYDQFFELYPNGCNDSHLKSAFVYIVKKAQRENPTL